MTAVSKFMFDTVFGQDTEQEEAQSVGQQAQSEETVQDENEPEEIEEEEEEELPGYSEAQLEEAKTEAFEAGKIEGAKQASETIEKETLLTLQAISQHITELFGKQEQSNSVLLRDGIGIAATIARKLFPAMNEQNSLGEIDRLVEHTLLRLIEEPRVVIRVNPDLVDALGNRVDGLKAGAGYEGRIVLKEDTSLPYGDCRMEWGDGSAERNVAALWGAIDDIISGNLGIDPSEETTTEAVEISALPPAEPAAEAAAGQAAGDATDTPEEEAVAPAAESNSDNPAVSPGDAQDEIAQVAENPNETAASSPPAGEDVAALKDDAIVDEPQEDGTPSQEGEDTPEDAPEEPSS